MCPSAEFRRSAHNHVVQRGIIARRRTCPRPKLGLIGVRPFGLDGNPGAAVLVVALKKIDPARRAATRCLVLEGLTQIILSGGSSHTMLAGVV